jgi:hypothetical protein
MARLHERLIALAADERRTLAALAEHALEPAGEGLALAARDGMASVRIRDVIGEAEALARVFEAAESGVIDVADPVVRAWLGGRRDALLALLRDDRAALYDQLAAARASSIAPDSDPGIAARWRLVDEDLEELALIARLLSDALDAARGVAA